MNRSNESPLRGEKVYVPGCRCHCILHVRSGGGHNYARQISGESADAVWEPLLLKSDPPPLTWRIALTTVYALTCYTVITVEYQEEIEAATFLARTVYYWPQMYSKWPALVEVCALRVPLVNVLK